MIVDGLSKASGRPPLWRCGALRPGVACALLACTLLSGVLLSDVAIAQEPSRAPVPPAARFSPAPPAQPSPAQPTPEAPAVAPDLVPGPAFQPGFIDALGRWLGDSKTRIDEQLKSTQDVLKSTQEAIDGIGTQAGGVAKDVAKDAAGAAQQATGALITLPGTHLVNGRERCPPAANGAPDCAPAVEALCRGKGYAAGRSVDVKATQKCPAWVWRSGRLPTEGQCASETYVLKAMCQ
jgi:hypothetical protein